MTCDEARIELPPYARGELEGRQRASLEEHLGDCGGCKEELNQVRRVVELVGAAKLAAPPSEGLKSATLGMIRQEGIGNVLRSAALGPRPPADLRERALKRATGQSSPPQSPTSRRMPLIAGTLAVAALVAALLALGFRAQIGALEEEIGDLQESVEEKFGPEGHRLQTFDLAGPEASAEAELTHFRHDNYRLSLMAEDFPLTPTGRHYELWLTGDKGEVSLGTFRVTQADELTFNFSIGVDPAEFPIVELTIEPNDGDPAQSGELVARAHLDGDNVHHGDYEK